MKQLSKMTKDNNIIKINTENDEGQNNINKDFKQEKLTTNSKVSKIINIYKYILYIEYQIRI